MLAWEAAERHREPWTTSSPKRIIMVATARSAYRSGRFQAEHKHRMAAPAIRWRRLDRPRVLSLTQFRKSNKLISLKVAKTSKSWTGSTSLRRYLLAQRKPHTPNSIAHINNQISRWHINLLRCSCPPLSSTCLPQLQRRLCIRCIRGQPLPAATARRSRLLAWS